MDHADLTATAARRALAAGQLSPIDLLEACLARLSAREASVRAMAFLDPELPRAAARSPANGKLRGLPIGVKDVIDTADMPTEFNSPIWRGHRPRDDAAAVAWARHEGAVVVGKTVTTEFATRTPGPTTNPHNSAHTPGGSSSGSAAGVAAGFFPFAFGTQTAGSVIRPAAYCGVVGYKPSFGTINRAGLKVMSDDLDTIGVFARSVADCALLVGAVSGRDLGDPDIRPERAPRIGLCRSPAWPNALPETIVMLEQAAVTLSRAGATVRDLELAEEPFGCLHRESHAVVMSAQIARSLGWELATARDRISSVLLESIDAGLSRTEAAYDAGLADFRAGQLAFPVATQGVDILVTPAGPGEAPAGLSWTGDPTFNLLWTALHVPCVTVPAGRGPKGLPLGIQIVGRRGEDRATLAWAQWVAAALA